MYVENKPLGAMEMIQYTYKNQTSEERMNMGHGGLGAGWQTSFWFLWHLSGLTWASLPSPNSPAVWTIKDQFLSESAAKTQLGVIRWWCVSRVYFCRDQVCHVFSLLNQLLVGCYRPDHWHPLGKLLIVFATMRMKFDFFFVVNTSVPFHRTIYSTSSFLSKRMWLISRYW